MTLLGRTLSLRIRCALACVIGAIAPSPAQAQEPLVPVEANRNAVVAPRAIETPAPPYPPSETEPATVVLTLVVAPDGTVREVRATEGREPFTTIAEGAARAWKFEPARRGDTPIAATIRIAVDFTPPPPPPPEAAPTAPPAPAPPPPPVQEIRVRGEKPPPPPPAAMGRADIRQLPGAMGDPLRAIEVLPGVSPTVSGLPFFYMRGAPPNASSFMLDELRMPYLFHAGLGPSIIHPAFVRGVTLEPASGHPRFGRSIGSFVAATTNEPPDETTWEGRVRVIDSSAFVASPFADGRAHAEVAATVSYTGPLLSLFAPDYTIDYRDYATRISYDLGPRDRLTFLSLGSYDFTSQIDRKEEQVLFASEIYRADLKWQHKLEGGGELRSGLTWGYDRSRLVARRFARDLSLAARMSAHHEFPKVAKLEGGFDTRFDSYAADLPSVHSLTRDDYEETLRLFADRVDTVTGAYVASTWRTFPKVDLMTGLRSDVYASQHKSVPTLEPRTTLAYSPIQRLRLLTSHGIAHQPPAYAVPLPALAIPGLRGGLQRSLQSSVTTEVTGPFGVTGGVTAFQGIFTNLSDFVLLQSDFPLKPAKPVQGKSLGLELSLKRPIRKSWGMIVSYTLSRSTREEDGRPTRLSSYDRTHVFNAALLFDLGKGFNVGVRTLLYTGLLRDPESGKTDRLPSFARLDARLSKRWNWGKSGWVGFVLEALNATASRETVALRCDADGCEPRFIGPLTVPSVSIEGGM